MSVLELIAMGAQFYYDASARPRVRRPRRPKEGEALALAKAGAVLEALAAAVAARAVAFAPYPPPQPFGTCERCLEPMEDFRAGVCWICAFAEWRHKHAAQLGAGAPGAEAPR